MSQIRFRCYHCQRIHTVAATAHGKRGRCACGKVMIVPPPPSEGEAPGDDTALPLAGPPPAEPPPAPQAAPPRFTAAPRPPASSDGSSTGAAERRVQREREPAEGAFEDLPASDWSSSQKRPAAPRASPRSGPMLGIPEVLLSAAALALALAHVFPSELAGMGLPFPEDTNYLALPTALWVTLLFALGGVLLLDGIIRIAGSRE